VHVFVCMCVCMDASGVLANRSRSWNEGVIPALFRLNSEFFAP
jgi:hypothetical protein